MGSVVRGHDGEFLSFAAEVHGQALALLQKLYGDYRHNGGVCLGLTITYLCKALQAGWLSKKDFGIATFVSWITDEEKHAGRITVLLVQNFEKESNQLTSKYDQSSWWTTLSTVPIVNWVVGPKEKEGEQKELSDHYSTQFGFGKKYPFLMKHVLASLANTEKSDEDKPEYTVEGVGHKASTASEKKQLISQIEPCREGEDACVYLVLIDNHALGVVCDRWGSRSGVFDINYGLGFWTSSLAKTQGCLASYLEHPPSGYSVDYLEIVRVGKKSSWDTW